MGEYANDAIETELLASLEDGYYDIEDFTLDFSAGECLDTAQINSLQGRIIKARLIPMGNTVARLRFVKFEGMRYYFVLTDCTELVSVIGKTFSMTYFRFGIDRRGCYFIASDPDIRWL
jgi:hypothetical protein